MNKTKQLQDSRTPPPVKDPLTWDDIPENSEGYLVGNPETSKMWEDNHQACLKELGLIPD